MEILLKIMLQDMDNYGIKMVIHIKANGKIFRQKDGEFIILKKESFSKDNGQEINKMDLELKEIM